MFFYLVLWHMFFCKKVVFNPFIPCDFTSICWWINNITALGVDPIFAQLLSTVPNANPIFSPLHCPIEYHILHIWFHFFFYLFYFFGAELLLTSNVSCFLDFFKDLFLWNWMRLTFSLVFFGRCFAINCLWRLVYIRVFFCHFARGNNTQNIFLPLRLHFCTSNQLLL